MTHVSTTRALRWGAAAVLAAVAFGALVAAQDAGSSTPGTNGRIVFAREVGEQFRLFTVRPDGTDLRRITTPGGATNPDWSPDGRTIAFGLEKADTAGVAVMNANGTQLRTLTPTGFQGQPSFSPDGAWIVFERDASPSSNGVWLIRRDGTGLRRVTSNPFKRRDTCGCDTDPNFSPDGKWISFVRIKAQHTKQALFMVRRNGTGLRQVTPYSWEVAIKHDWSPDGRLIVLTTNADFVRPNESANIVTIRPDGSGKTELTRFTGGKENAFAGSFSPDGTQIVFRLEEGDSYSLAVMDLDGGNIRRLTTGKDKPRFIDWGTHR